MTPEELLYAAIFWGVVIWAVRKWRKGNQSPSPTPEKPRIQWPPGASISFEEARSTKVTLRWPPAQDESIVSKYGVYRDDELLATYPALVHFHEVKGLKAGEPHTYRVEACDAFDRWTDNGPRASFATPDTRAPTWPEESVLTARQESLRVDLSWPEARDNVKVTRYRVRMDGEEVTTMPARHRTFSMTQLSPGQHLFRVDAGDAAGNWSRSGLEVSITVETPSTDPSWPTPQPQPEPPQPQPEPPPPPPAVTAPPLDTSVSTPMDKAVEFIHSGPSPRQVGLKPGTLSPHRVSVLRGTVRSSDGAPLPNVSIRILGHAEYGSARSDSRGTFDLVVNGGGALTVVYEKPGLLTAQRRAEAGWNGYQTLPDVTLVARSARAERVSFAADAGPRMLRGGVVKDADGERRVNVFIPPGTQASLVQPDGGKRPVDALSLRITEFTVGERGAQAMPGDLPPSSGYTFAVELTADEVTAKVDGRDIVFDRDVYVSVDNFLRFPVGTVTPSGYYDEGTGAWIPSRNGRVIRVITVDGGLARVDVDGSGQSADKARLEQLGLSTDEQRMLATHFSPGASLWRVPLDHFSVWDFNWPFGPPRNAKPPPKKPKAPKKPDKNCHQPGCVISLQNQVLGDSIPIAGTGFSLAYQSDRVPGHLESRTLSIPVSGPELPPGLKGLAVEIHLLGRVHAERFSPAPGFTHAFTWDLKDGFGRTVQGRHKARVRTGHVYDGVYQTPSDNQRAFAELSGTQIEGSRTRQEITLWNEWDEEVGLWDARGQGLGGWTLSVVHGYDPGSRTLFLGDGRRRTVQGLGQRIETLSGDGSAGHSGDGGPAAKAQLDAPQGAAVGPDGSFYFADWGNHSIRRIDPTGIITTVAGSGRAGDKGDGGPALKAELHQPHRVTLGPDGSLYISDQNNHRIRKVRPDGVIVTVAGNGTGGDAGDGGPAIQAQLNLPRSVAVAPDGTLYIADTYNHRIRKVAPDGVITTLAGTGHAGDAGDSGPAVKAELHGPQELILARDGRLFIADQLNHRIRCIHPDGTITTVAGNGDRGFGGDGGPATAAQLSDPEGCAVDSAGNLYIADGGNARIRLVDASGRISTFAGTGEQGSDGDGGPARGARFREPHAIAIHHDGSLIVSDPDSNQLRRIAAPLAGFTVGEITIASEDGEELYVFDGVGRHQRTLDASSGDVLLRFHYDGSGGLIEVASPEGTLLKVERDARGLPVALISHDSRRTGLRLDAEGFLGSVQPVQGAEIRLGYAPNGLLTERTEAGRTSRYEYDALGLLTVTHEPDGRVQTLTRTTEPTARTVTLRDGAGRVSSFRSETGRDGEERRINTYPGGLRTEVIDHGDGRHEIIESDGTRTTLRVAPDPRFGLQVMKTEEERVVTPSGLESVKRYTRKVELGPSGPLDVRRSEELFEDNGRVTRIQYDRKEQRLLRETPEGQATELLYDEQARVREIRSPGLAPVKLSHDANGHVVEMARGDRKRRIERDATGALSSLADSLGGSVRLGWDAEGRLVEESTGSGMRVAYTYDAQGALASVTPPGRPPHRFERDAAGRLSAYRPPPVQGATPETKFEYDAAGRLIRLTHGGAASLSWTYDEAGRPSTVTIPQGNIASVYDGKSGQLTRASDPSGGVHSREYDGRLLVGLRWEGAVSGRVRLGYSAGFQLTTEEVEGTPAIPLEYNNDEQLIRAGELILERSRAGGHLSEAILGEVREAFEFDAHGELRSSEVLLRGQPLFTRGYERDALGRVTQVTEQFQGEQTVLSYRYDERGRLTEVSRAGQRWASFAYDANGNCVRRMEQGREWAAVYDDRDRLVSWGPRSYAYDEAGTLRSITEAGRSTHYDSDPGGTLRGVRLPDGTRVEYVVDGLGQRLGKRVHGTLTQGFLYGMDGQLLAELDGAGKVVSRFVYGSRTHVPDYLIKDGAAYRILTDHLGSPRLIVHAQSGELAQRLDYDVFGAVLQDTRPGFQPFGFAGGLFDAQTGLVHFGARDYEPATGRWTARDPLLFGGGDTNLYEYVGGDPINSIDPLGLHSLKFDGTNLYYYDDQGKLLGTYPASSGMGGSKNYTMPNHGPIPPGRWMLDPSQVSGGFFHYYWRNVPYRYPNGSLLNEHVGDWGSYLVPLRPAKGTNTFNRDLTSFYLHGGNDPGTLGCVDVGTLDTDLLPKLGQHKGPIRLDVVYPKGYGPKKKR